MNFWPVCPARLGCQREAANWLPPSGEGDSAVSKSCGTEQFSAQPGDGLLVCVGEDAAWAQLISLAWPCWLVSLQAGGLSGCCVTRAVETH